MAGVADWYAFTLSFKGVLLEGLEVAFIVVTFGSNAHDVPLAVLGAVCAVVAVAILGLAVRAPLARVPENSMKFVVGVMLTAFGIFWGAEGAGAQWPGEDAALLVLAPAVAVFGLVLIAVLRRVATAHLPNATRRDSRGGDRMIARLRAFGAFWYDFIVGDDWRVAVGVVLALVLTKVLSVTTSIAVWWVLPVAVLILLPYSLLRVIRR